MDGKLSLYTNCGVPAGREPPNDSYRVERALRPVSACDPIDVRWLPWMYRCVSAARSLNSIAGSARMALLPRFL